MKRVYFVFFNSTHSGYILRHLLGESTSRSWQPRKESFCVAHKRKTANELGRRRLRWFTCFVAPCSYPYCAQSSSSLATALCKLSLSYRILSLSSYHTCSGTVGAERQGLLWGYSWQRLLCMPDTPFCRSAPGNYYIHIYICITPRTLSQYFVASPRSVRCLKLFKALRGFYFVSLRRFFFFFHFNFLSRQSAKNN